MMISIHALLAESDSSLDSILAGVNISIHALLAESDLETLIILMEEFDNFYPRSPCGERLAGPSGPAFLYNFYPRSPCGERQFCIWRT